MTISLSLAIALPTQSPIPIFLLGDRLPTFGTTFEASNFHHE
ncbi:hypothetical protein [uncultured Nostoc sp.]